MTRAAQLVMAIVVGATIAASCARAPRITAADAHAAMAPGSPDQLCLICHREGDDETPTWPHAEEPDEYRRCPSCHGPRHPASPAPLFEAR